jgi:hypothetical protein
VCSYIKSNLSVQQEDLRTLLRMADEFKDAELVCFSKDIRKKCYGKVVVWPWQEGVLHYFGE